MAREPIHPGEFLADELEALNMSAAEFACLLHVPANRISQIVAGKRNVTADTALRLGRYFGPGAKIWLNLQQAYELDVVTQQPGSKLERIPQREAESEAASL